MDLNQFDVNQCIDRLDAIFRRAGDLQSPHRTRIVDVPNGAVWNDVSTRFMPTLFDVVDLEFQCASDALCTEQALWRVIEDQQMPLLLRGVTTFWRFRGDGELKRLLRDLVNYRPKYPLVVVSYQCKTILNEIVDERSRDCVMIVSGNPAPIPSIIVVDGDSPLSKSTLAGRGYRMANGIRKVPGLIEDPTSIDSESGLGVRAPAPTIVVSSKIKKSDIPNCMYSCKWIEDGFDKLQFCDNSLQQLDRTWGAATQWQRVYEGVARVGSFKRYVETVFGTSTDKLEDCLGKYGQSDDYVKWLYWVALKRWRPESEYLARCVRACDGKRGQSLIECLYREFASMYDSVPEDELEKGKFERDFDERKRLLQQCGRSIVCEGSRFCEWIGYKGEGAFDDLTGLTPSECEYGLKWLCKYGAELSNEAILGRLKRVIPRLYDYLLPYDNYRSKGVKAEDLQAIKSYFEAYKRQVVVNRVDESFIETVNAEGSTHRRYALYPPRDIYVDEIVKRSRSEKVFVYLVDALGTEFLSYIEQKCKRQGLSMSSNLARAKLPTVTSVNYGALRERLTEKSILNQYVGEIDDIKHNRSSVQTNPEGIPLHLYKELDAIDRLFAEVVVQLMTAGVASVWFVPDHGATRLGVIYGGSKRYSAYVGDEKIEGLSHGRYCHRHRAAIESGYAIESDDGSYLVCSNYDRFGGRQSCEFEVHGGATIEEVIVPIIEIRNPNAKEEFIVKTPTVFVDNDRPAIVDIYSVQRHDRLSLRIDSGPCTGRLYEAMSRDGKNFSVSTSIYSPGIYMFSLFDGERWLAGELQFEAQARGFVENEDSFFD